MTVPFSCLSRFLVPVPFSCPYTNYVGLPILYVAIDSTGENMWGTFYRYNDNGQVIWQAMPSAVALPSDLSTLDGYSDLMNYDTTTLRYEYVNNGTGLIEVTDYFGPSETPAGYVKDLQVQQGQSGFGKGASFGKGAASEKVPATVLIRLCRKMG